MARCSICGEEIPASAVFQHRRERHPAEAQASTQKGLEKIQQVRAAAQAGAGGVPLPSKDGKQPPAPAREARRTHPLSPVNAALVEFVNQTFVIPNNPALVYGFLCAKKLGFEGDMGMFLMEVIDDFYDRRHMNYYEEVAGWDGIGDAIRQLPESDGRAA